MHRNSEADSYFTQLAEQHMDGVFNYARYMLSDSAEAGDVTQKTFLKAYQQLDRLDRSSDLKPWLFTVARNLCLDYLKQKKAQNFSELEEYQVENIPEAWHSIEEQLDSQMYLEKIKAVVEGLPVQFKEVLVLKYFEDQTFETIAQILGIPENTAKTNFYRGKSLLFKKLQSST